jgi:hypothetical protein
MGWTGKRRWHFPVARTSARLPLASKLWYGVFLTPGEAVLALESEDGRPAVLRLQLMGASATALARPLEELPGKVHYFIGNDPAGWRPDVPTYGGISYWTNAVSSGGASRAQVVEFFFNSAEFQGTFAPITRLYFAYFLSIPDYAGLLFWQRGYRSGLPLSEISEAFAATNEFQNTYGQLTDDEFVTLVYQNVLGRDPGRQELVFWTQALQGRLSRADLMLAVSQSGEYLLRSFQLGVRDPDVRGDAAAGAGADGLRLLGDPSGRRQLGAGADPGLPELDRVPQPVLAVGLNWRARGRPPASLRRSAAR